MLHPAVLVAGLALLAVLLHRQRGFGDPATPAPPAAPAWRAAALVALVLLGVALRLVLCRRAGPDTYELATLAEGRAWLAALTGQLQGSSGAFYHPPLQPLLVLGWARLLDALGLPPTLAWLRAPNLLVSAAHLLLLARLGRLLGAPAAGLATAFLLAVLPLALRASVLQESYLLDGALTALFLERLVVALTTRGRLLGLALAAAALLWSSWMGAPVVALGGVALLVASFRDRRLLAPVTALTFLVLALAAPLPRLLAGVAAFDHEALSLPRAVEVLAGALVVGTGWPGVLLAGSALVTLRRRPRLLAFLAAVVVGYAAVAVTVRVRECNLTPLVPLALGAGLVGLEGFLAEGRPFRRAVALVGLAALLAFHAWAPVRASGDTAVDALLFDSPYDGKMGRVRDLAPLRALLLAPDPTPSVLVVVDEAATFDALAPLAARSSDELLAALDDAMTRPRDRVGTLDRVQLGAWTLLGVPAPVDGPAAAPPSPESLDRVLTDPALADRPFVLLASRRVDPAWREPLRQALDRHGRACTPRAEPASHDALLWDCAAPSTPPGASDSR